MVKKKINYTQIVPQNYEERIKMYMKMSKKKLAEMLAARDSIYVAEAVKTCTSWDDCINLHKDCINCPVRNVSSYTYITSSTNTLDNNSIQNFSIDSLRAKI